MSERIRSFLAVDVEDRQVLSKILEAQERLRRTGADLKIVETENLHLTLRFLGEVPSATLDSLRKELDQLRFSEFQAEFKGMGAFPSLNYMNVIWIGLGKGGAEMSEISSKVEPMVTALGIPPDRKGFSPHLTIARVRTRRGKEEMVKIIHEMQDYAFGTMRVNAVTLKRSVLTPQGPVYTTIHQVKAQ